MKILGLITARGGSKRVPRKNIKMFFDKPLIVWTIEVIQKSSSVKKWILSTEDTEIAEIGRGHGIDIPFLRPKELAEDDSSSFDVVRHSVLWLRDHEEYFADWVVLLEPTSPGRQPFHIDEVVKIIEQKNNEIDSICAVTEALGCLSAYKSLKIDKDNNLTRFYDNTSFRNIAIRNQDVPSSYYINSAIYAFKVSNLFLPMPSIWGNKVYGYVMDSKYSFDIDTPEDWIIAEAKMQELLKK